MNDRRKFLKGVSGAAAGLAATAAVGAVQQGSTAKKGAKLTRAKLYGRAQLPEAMVETMDGKRLHLYADLIRGKAVVLNYMAIDNEARFPITAKLVEIAKKLGPRFGKDVQFISITSDAVRDTPARLRAFARKMGVPDHGWQFVRVLSEEEGAVLAMRLYRHHRKPDPHTRLDAMHYGNEPVGLWGLFPSSIAADDAVLRIRSILPGGRSDGEMRRAGPRKLDEAGLPFNHRVG